MNGPNASSGLSQLYPNLPTSVSVAASLFRAMNGHSKNVESTSIGMIRLLTISCQIFLNCPTTGSPPGSNLGTVLSLCT
jgi:hypothetical protein